MEIDTGTLEELREMEPRQAYERLRQAVYQAPGGASSEDFQAILEQMVREGILTWAEIERIEES